MVYADPFHNYCVALVVPARKALEKWAQDLGINFKDFGELCLNDQATKVEASNSYARILIFGSFLLLSFVKFFSLPLFYFFDLAFYCLFFFFI
jgi:hypothetical protein